MQWRRPDKIIWFTVLFCLAYMAQAVEPVIYWWCHRKQNKKPRQTTQPTDMAASQNAAIFDSSFTPRSDSTPDDTSTA